MRSLRWLFSLALVLTATASFAHGPVRNIYIPIAGNAQGGNFFRTDARIFNPSSTEVITVTPRFLPINQNNSAVPAGAPITVGKREMLVFDNVVQSLFNTTGFGAVQFSAEDDFVVTSKTFTDATCGTGTFGQFVPASNATAAKVKGVILQLSVSPDNTTGFRSNVGFLNPNAVATTVTLRLHRPDGTLVKDATLILDPFGAKLLSVQAIFALPTLSLSNARVSFTSPLPVLGYGSVVDNRSADQIFLDAIEDTGSDAPPVQAEKVFNIVSSQWTFTVSPGPQIRVNRGDRVVLRLTSVDVPHGFLLQRYVPTEVIASQGSPREMVFTADTAGSFTYFCTVSACGSGHSAMNGQMIVDP